MDLLFTPRQIFHALNRTFFVSSEEWGPTVKGMTLSLSTAGMNLELVTFCQSSSYMYMYTPSSSQYTLYCVIYTV